MSTSGQQTTSRLCDSTFQPALKQKMDGLDSKKEFPFVIGERHVPNIAREIFKHLDRNTLLKARRICREWKHHVDKNTPLWNQFSSEIYHRPRVGRFSSPMHAAAWTGNVEMCKLLLENCKEKQVWSLTQFYYVSFLL